MAPSSNLVLLLMLAFLTTQFVNLCYSTAVDFSANAGERCVELEREALIDFKGGLRDPDHRLSSWTGRDCCGIRCNNIIGHVVRLDLRNRNTSYLEDWSLYTVSPDTIHGGVSTYSYYKPSCISGEIRPSLLNLVHLNYLDLSYNCFDGFPIPLFIGSLRELKYLNLSMANFTGEVPQQLGNLSNLHYLDLSGGTMMSHHNDYMYSYPPHVENLHWLSHMSLLQYVDLSYIDLSKASPSCFEVFNSLPSLRVLRVISSGLNGSIPSFDTLNLTSISHIDLSENDLSSTIPNWFFNLTTLKYLSLYDNNFYGPLRSSFGESFPSLQVLDLSRTSLSLDNMTYALDNLCNLRSLDLSQMNLNGELSNFGWMFSRCHTIPLQSLNLYGNNINGIIPESFGQLKNLNLLDLGGNALSGALPASLGNISSLQELYLDDNFLNETIPTSIGQLSELVILDIHNNSLNCVILEAHFSNLSKLQFLRMSSNSLVIKFSVEWVPPFQLRFLDLSLCTVGPQFPLWIQLQSNLSKIILSHTGITDTIPHWFWDMTYKINSLDLSFNNITGALPSSLKFGIFARVSLKSNLIHGLMPRHFSEGLSLDLSNNSLSGSLPHKDSWRNLSDLFISRNNITGTIPASFCNLRSFVYLDLSNNRLHGRIPNCRGVFPPALADFSNNKLSGPLPNSFCFSPYVNQMLIFYNNSLTGVLPSSLQRCTDLTILDLGANKLAGSVPSWFGASMPRLTILLLGHNMFSGNIPWQLSNLSNLHILDLSSNRLRGPIPSSFGNFSAMKIKDGGNLGIIIDGNALVVTMKARVSVFTDSWTHENLRVIDLSDNNLIGNIPEEIAGLVGLDGLNLSHNLLTGEITTKIGALTEFQSLDLSRNKLSGPIPQSLSILTSLEALDLSYNNLSGRIPTGNQLQTFNGSSFAGNPDLCGMQLNKTCPGDKPNRPTKSTTFTSEIGDEDHDKVWLYIITSCGFLLGLWTVYMILLLKRNWRHAYFKTIDEVQDELSLYLMLRWSRLRKKLWIRV